MRYIYGLPTGLRLFSLFFAGESRLRPATLAIKWFNLFFWNSVNGFSFLNMKYMRSRSTSLLLPFLVKVISFLLVTFLLAFQFFTQGCVLRTSLVIFFLVRTRLTDRALNTFYLFSAHCWKINKTLENVQRWNGGSNWISSWRSQPTGAVVASLEYFIIISLSLSIYQLYQI